jgi:hypothetical protein
MDLVDNFNQTTNQLLDPVQNDPILHGVLLIFLVVYGTLAAPRFPRAWRAYFDNIYVRVTMLSLLVWIASKDPVSSIVAAVVFIAVLNLASGKPMFERFTGPRTAIYPGCTNFTVFDLLESFKNDKGALLNAMLASRVPGDVKLTDEYAPLIATYLLNRGFHLKSPCTPPGVHERSTSWI